MLEQAITQATRNDPTVPAKRRVVIETGKYGYERIYMEYDPAIEGWATLGDTYAHKETIKSYTNARWDGVNRLWIIEEHDLPEAMQRLGTVVPVGGEPSDTPAPEVIKHEVPVEKIVYRNLTRKRKSSKRTPKPRKWQRVQPQTGPLPKWFVKPSWWDYISAYIQSRPAIALVGPAGNGKTTTAEIALTAHGTQYLIMNCTDRTEVNDLVGGLRLTPNGEEWVDGIVTTAFREGKAVILDEADALDPRVMMALQTALLDPGPEHKSRYIAVNGEKVYPASTCPIVMTMNTVGSGANREYVGRNRLDAAGLDRITMLQTGYENEVEMLQARGIKKALAGKIVKWAERTRKAIDDNALRQIVSPRTMLRIAECVESFGWDFDLAIKLEFLSRLEPQDWELLQ